MPLAYWRATVVSTLPNTVLVVLFALWVTPLTLLAQEAATPANPVIVPRTSLVLDGRGGVLRDRDIVIRNAHIAEIVPAGQGQGDRVFDLTDFTVLPGLIDTHVHMDWHFGPDGKLALSTELPDRVMYAAENAHKMLTAGVTTVQSLGAAPATRPYGSRWIEGFSRGHALFPPWGRSPPARVALRNSGLQCGISRNVVRRSSRSSGPRASARGVLPP